MAEQNFIGIEIGGTKLQLVIADASLTIKDKISLQVNQDNGAKGIQQKIEESINKLKTNKRLTAIGVGFGGPVNYKTGTISTSHQIDGWNGFNLKTWLQQISGVPAFIDNDANVAALGEAVHGTGGNYQIVFYMTIGSGIGGGLVINKQIYHGAFPGEVEIGHIRLDKDGQTLEDVCSGWAVDKKIRETILAEPQGLLATLAGSCTKGEARFLRIAAEKGDAKAIEIMKASAENIAFALSHVVHLFHPEAIIIGGGLSLIGEPLSNQIASSLSGYILKSFLPAPKVKIASLGKMVVPIGALELAKASYRKSTNKF
ncbi:MAG: ROK family protein [Segetibacter sp.]